MTAKRKACAIVPAQARGQYPTSRKSGAQITRYQPGKAHPPDTAPGGDIRAALHRSRAAAARASRAAGRDASATGGPAASPAARDHGGHCGGQAAPPAWEDRTVRDARPACDLSNASARTGVCVGVGAERASGTAGIVLVRQFKPLQRIEQLKHRGDYNSVCRTLNRRSRSIAGTLAQHWRSMGPTPALR